MRPWYLLGLEDVADEEWPPEAGAHSEAVFRYLSLIFSLLVIHIMTLDDSMSLCPSLCSISYFLVISYANQFRNAIFSGLSYFKKYLFPSDPVGRPAQARIRSGSHREVASCYLFLHFENRWILHWTRKLMRMGNTRQRNQSAFQEPPRNSPHHKD